METKFYQWWKNHRRLITIGLFLSIFAFYLIIPFEKEDEAFAEEIRKTLTTEEIAASFQRAGRQTPPELPLCDFVAPLDRPSHGGEGSTDVGDVSWVTPTVQARVATCAVGTPFHTWQTVAQGKAPAAHKGMVHAAKVMAATATHLINSSETLKAARDVHDKRQQTTPYVCPIPPLSLIHI